MSAQEPEGLTFDMGPDPVPAPAESGGWRGSLRDFGGWWGLLRFLPSAIRQAFSEREPVGGLPVVEPGQSRPAELPDSNFGDSCPTADHTAELTAEAVAEDLAAQTPVPDAGIAAEAVAASGDPVSVAEVVSDLAASLGVDLDAAAGAAEPVAETMAADTADALAELGEAGL